MDKNALFQTSDLSLNRSGTSALLTDRAKILNTAVTLEGLDVRAYKGAGLSLTDPTYLLPQVRSFRLKLAMQSELEHYWDDLQLCFWIFIIF